MKNKKNILLLVIVLIIICAFSYFLINISKNKSDYITFKKEYESLNGKRIDANNKLIDVKINNSKVKYLTSNILEKSLSDKKSAVIYIGTASCAYCRSVAEILNDVINESELQEFYYYKNDDKKDDYEKMLNILDSKFKNDNELKEPTVLFIVDGEITSYKIGTLFSHSDPYKKMTDEERKGLERIYNSGIDLVIEANKLSKGCFS